MNSKLTIALVDDNTQTLQLVSNAVKTVFASLSVDAEIEGFSNPKAFLEEIKEREYDLLFLDIEMPDIDGIELAKMIRERYLSTTIIFLSNREDRVFETFEVAPFGFIRKSRFLEDINEIINLYVKRKYNPTEEKTFVIKGSRETISLPIKNIVYIENKDHFQYFHTSDSDEVFVARQTMKAITDELSSFGFIEPCKGYLVNYRYISAIRNDDIVLTTKKILPLSRRKSSQFTEEYMNYKKKDMSVIL